MFRFLETICFQKEAYGLLDYHQARIDRTFEHFYPNTTPFNLHEILPGLSSEGKIKVRLRYDEHNHDIGIVDYTQKSISRLLVVEAEKLDYSFKYLDRSMLSQHLPADNKAEILIIINDIITDTSYSNVIFKQNNHWYTPSSYLLNGVKRQRLLDQGIITERPISRQDIADYSEISLINAMLDPGDITLPIDKIID